ncbi:MAG: YegP family protein [Thermoleophilia bacterium]|nr:YegP family protein [Thermoleophilia bacterium]MDH3724887.1 YegP family protein [Thermoleophilia bacterium]
MPGKFELKKSSDDQFYFNLKAGNGQVILTSELYTSKSSANKGIASVRKNCSLDTCFHRHTSKAGQPCFVLKARNGETIGASQMYASSSSCEKGIAAVKANGGSERVDDRT